MTNNIFLDRSKIPAISIPKKLNLPKYDKIYLSNNLPVYIIEAGVQDVCKIEWVFNAGRWYESQKHVSRFTNRMLKEGTTNYSAAVIAEKIDFWGATFRNSSSVDHGNFSLVCLNKYLHEVLPVVSEVLQQPVFPEKELTTIIRNSKEKLKIDLQKNDYLADQKMNAALYGNTHAYGYDSEAKNYDVIKIDLLKQHYDNFYHAGNGFLLLSGKINDEVLQQIERYFGGKEWSKKVPEIPVKLIEPETSKIIIEKKPDSFQSAIRICKSIIGKTHKDYQKLSVLNTILGGYFGSRLMSNVREDKGYTYGIYSGITNMLHNSFFYVSTEVGVDVAENAVNEIIFEIKRLQSETVDAEEVELVQNYLTGKMLGNFDTPFNIAAAYKNLFIYGLDIDYFHALIDTIHSITPEDLIKMANQYLNVDDMYQITIG